MAAAKEDESVPERFDPELLPKPFPLNNTGVICFFNSMLQALASQTAFVRAVRANPEYMCATKTGAALLAFVEAFSGGGEVADHSRRVLGALTEDLARRRPKVRFG